MMEKEKALEMALSQIEKDFGKGAIMRLGDAASKISVSTIPSGCLELDLALGVGGKPRGRIIEIYGPESSCKTTIALHIIAEAQKLGGTAAFIDAEHALDPVYAENLGVDVDELYVSQPDTGEDALEICETLVRSGAMDVVVIDCVDVIWPKAKTSFQFGIIALGIQMLIGYPLGVLMARSKGKFVDTLGNAYVLLINALPAAVYFLAIQLYLSTLLKLPMLFDPLDWKSRILPIICLSLGGIASNAMWMRRYMVDQMNMDYIRLARAKGMTSSQVAFRQYRL